MSKIVRKCPNCGATMPMDVKYCRKCHAKLDSGRVENLAASAQAQKKTRRRSQEDALHDLPKPVRPVEEADETVNAAAGAAVGAAAGDGFFNPEYTENGQRRPVRQGEGNGPKPVSTARNAGERPQQSKSGDRNLWKIITVLAVIFVIIVAAIVLVLRLNQPAGETVQTSEVFTPPVADTQEGGLPMIAPTNTPVPTPTATPEPTATPVPSPTPEPTATPEPTQVPNYTITGMNDTVYVINGPVNLRRDPSQTLDPITQIQTGTALTRTGKTDNGWSRVSYNGQEGFVANNYLAATAPSSATTPPASGTTGSTGSTGTTGNTGSTGNTGNTGSTGSTGTTGSVTAASGTVTVATTSGANLRTGPGEGYKVYATVGVGTQLTRTGTTGGWTQVSYNGQTLYIATSLLQGSYTGENFSVTEMTGTGTVSGTSVNVRSGPGTGYKVLGTVNTGTSLTITGKSGDWYRVSYNSGTGYISSKYLSTGSSSGGSSSGGTSSGDSSSGTTSSTGKVTAEHGLFVRSGPGSNYDKLGSLSYGTSVTIVSESNGWYQINYNGKTGYVSSTYVQKG